MQNLMGIRKQKEQLEIAERVVEFELRTLLKGSSDKKYEFGDLVATYVEATRVSYDLEKLKLALPKSVFKQIVDIEYVVNKAAMRELLEDHPKLRKHIAPTLKQIVAVNKSKIEAAHSKGIVSLEDLKECCTIQTSEYTRMSQKERS